MLSPKAMACCRRIITASAKPRSSMTSPKIMYMIPIFLWSMLQIQSRHSGPQRRNLVMAAITPSPPSMTAMKVHSTMGSCAIGTASQLSRPKAQWEGETVSEDIGVSLALPVQSSLTAPVVVYWRVTVRLGLRDSRAASTRGAFCAVHTSCGRFRPAERT